MKSLLLPALSASLPPQNSPPILLWPGGAPGSEGKDTPEVVVTSASGEQQISNIHKPGIIPTCPPRKNPPEPP